MNKRTKLQKASLWAGVIALALVLGVDWGSVTRRAQADSPNDALLIQAEAAQGRAAPGNTERANFLVVVTDRTGTPVGDLVQSDFRIINHFQVPGATCGFSNNIVLFEVVANGTTGAYHIQVELGSVPGCSWAEGDYLTQIIVSDGTRRGQATATLSIKCPQGCTSP
jgi:hypothetical protein